ncbi:MAG: 4-(cytidine 5'-diphospho)-2-C-methyl-D-erythritol kinase [Pseudomonadota bacterium]
MTGTGTVAQATAVHRLAPAKINLALHVTGQRGDGYHLLDTLVAFADFGDRLDVMLSDAPKASLSGAFASGLTMDADNLVCRAEALWREAMRRNVGGQGLPPVHIHLTKNLPIASGIGGGSADAAAALLALQEMFGHPLPSDGLHALALALGADVPMCLASSSLRATGIGDVFEPVDLPSLPIVLVNPGVAVSTPTVFSNLEHKTHTPLSHMPVDSHNDDWLEWMSEQRNDLQLPAVRSAPVIAKCLAALETARGCLLARMSGSGATCFGVFADDESAQFAASVLSTSHSGWWVRAGRTI